MVLKFDVPDKYGNLLKEVMSEALKKLQEEEWLQMGRKYYYISKFLTAETDLWCNYDRDQDLLKKGNIFKTKEEAEFKIEQLKVLHELEELADDDQEWDNNTNHYTIAYNHDCASFRFEYWHTEQNCQFYFKSEQSARAAVNKIGVERLIKYYFCIPEEK